MIKHSIKAVSIFLFVPLLFACVKQKAKQEEIKETSPTKEVSMGASVVYNSVDGGRTWKSFDDGIPNDATVSSFLVRNDRILATTDFHGIYSIWESENRWKRIDEDLPVGIDINAISSAGNFLVIGTLKHGILISKNIGKNWIYPSNQIKTPVRCLHVMEEILFAGGDNGIYKSMDNGNTWQHVWKGVQVNGFAQAGDKIYAALMNGAVTSIDKGENWIYIFEPNTLHDISTDGERIYAMTLGKGLQQSGNHGVTWENANDGLGTPDLYTFEVKRFNKKLFAAQWYGIYTSNNWGKSWNLIKGGLPDSTAFMTLEVTRNGLIAGIGLRKE